LELSIEDFLRSWRNGKRKRKETFYLFPQELAQNIYVVSIKQLERGVAGKKRKARGEVRNRTRNSWAGNSNY